MGHDTHAKMVQLLLQEGEKLPSKSKPVSAPVSDETTEDEEEHKSAPVVITKGKNMAKKTGTPASSTPKKTNKVNGKK